MKKFNLALLSAFMLMAFTITSCSDDAESTPTPEPTTNNIVDVANANNFTILIDALDRADLTMTLEGEGPFTVFAPTDDAFTSLLAELNFNSLDDVPVPVLKEILMNHVVSGKVMSTDLSTGYVNTLASGPEATNVSMFIDLTDGIMINNRAKVTAPDVAADNGVVHVVDKVITIPSVVDVALSNPNFSTLVAALTNENLSADFVSILSGDGPFTIFAPTNDAFTALLNSNMDWNTLDDIPTATLEAVLSYHVIAGSNVTSSEITDGATPMTYQGTSITLNTTDGVTVTDGQSRVSAVVQADVQSSNGVIHAIDQVLIP